jgi:phospholipid transport system substrate-binding protein
MYPAREREEFTRLFTELLEQSYVGKIQAYPGRIVYTGESIDKTYAAVRSKILTAGQGEIAIEYRLHRAGMRWAVYDVVISGASFVSTYRAQFNEVLQAESLRGLLQKMRQAGALAVVKPVR